MPVREPVASDRQIRFEEPVGTPAIRETLVEPPHHNWLVHRDLASDTSTLEVIQDEGRVHIEEVDMDVTNRTWNWYTYQDDDFSSPKGETKTERAFGRGDWQVRTTTHTQLTADPKNFYIWAELDAWEGEKRIFSRNWDLAIPREFL